MAALAIAVSAAPASATTNYDLTTAGSTAHVTADTGGDLFVFQIDPQSTGTGVIDSFLRIQANDSEAGYNTSNNPPPLDDKGGNFTNAILLSSVPVATDKNGVQYLQFFLDINQTGSEPLLTLNQLQFYYGTTDPTAANATQNATGVTSESFNNATNVFTLNNNTTSPTSLLTLNYNLNSGSGEGDYMFFIRKSLFNAAPQNALLILYSQFGLPLTTATGTYKGSNDGFEEWFLGSALITGGPGDITVVPEPASLLLLGTGMGLIARRVRRKRTA